MRYDPYDPETQRDPYPVYRELRDRAPVYHDAERGFWALSRFDDVIWAAHEPAVFCSGEGIALEGQARSPFPNLITMDDPRHGQLRALVARGFTARPVAAYESRVRELARTMLDDLADDSGGDLVAGLTGPLPMTVVGDLIGVEPGDRERFRAWSDAIVHQDVDRPETVDAGRAAAGAVVEHFRGIIADRRDAARDDLVSALLDAIVDGERLSDEEILGFCFLLVVAGTETTTNLLGLGVLALAGAPGGRDRLTADPSLIGGAVEEMLRWGSPVQGLARTTTRPVSRHGVEIPAGAKVQLLFGSANRDERAFPEADRFDATRTIERHLAFGHGVHFCLGAALARLEARVVFEELLARYPRWEVDTEDVRWIRSTSVRGPAALPVTLRPTG
ncbi:MAG TPA: cytochrome P450 [Acidimicrobiia bacterium]